MTESEIDFDHFDLDHFDRILSKIKKKTSNYICIVRLLFVPL